MFFESKPKGWSVSPDFNELSGQYRRNIHVDITSEAFAAKMDVFNRHLNSLFAESKELEKEIQKQLGGLKYV